jgi:hypothetical protein
MPDVTGMIVSEGSARLVDSTANLEVVGVERGRGLRRGC